MLRKKYFVILFILALSLFFLKKDEMKLLANVLVTDYLKIMKTCYRADNDILEVFKQEGFDYYNEDKKVTDDGLKKIYAKPIYAITPKIPLISHHVYFTSTKTPRKLNAYYTGKLKATFDKLNQVNENWKHIIWTNMPDIFPEEIKIISNVEIKLLNEFSKHKLFPYLDKAIKNGDELTPYFSEASDLTRFIALENFGGMYNDMDFEIFNPIALTQLFYQYDFIGGRETTKNISYYASAFIAAKPNHPVLQEAIRREKRNYSLENVPNYVAYPCSEHARIYGNAPPLITMSYFSKNNIEGNYDVILPTWMIMNATFARYKNKDCNYDLVTEADFQNRENNIENLISSYFLEAKQEDGNDNNIYYSIKSKADFPIIAADMFCGGWSKNSKKIKKRNYYWNF